MKNDPRLIALKGRKVAVVDEKDNDISEADLIEAHLGNGLKHRAISVYIFRKNQGRIEVLLQKRSWEKIVGAHKWANTVCGNLKPQEKYLECALRRLKQELGIEISQLTPALKFSYFAKCEDGFCENELDQVFLGWYDENVTPNPDEVEEVGWVEWAKIHQWVRVNPTAPWFDLMLKRNDLIARIEELINEK